VSDLPRIADEDKIERRYLRTGETDPTRLLGLATSWSGGAERTRSFALRWSHLQPRGKSRAGLCPSDRQRRPVASARGWRRHLGNIVLLDILSVATVNNGIQPPALHWAFSLSIRNDRARSHSLPFPHNPDPRVMLLEERTSLYRLTSGESHCSTRTPGLFDIQIMSFQQETD